MKILLLLTTCLLLLFPKQHSGQTPNLGTAAGFVLFTGVGAVTNTGISHLTGHVGSNSGSSTGFGNVNGVMHDGDPASILCAADLLIAYGQLNSAVPTFFPAPLLGNGQLLNTGVYSIAGPATLNLGLTLDAQGNPNAIFIFQIQGAFSAAAGSKVNLINGALACNVFWKVEGLVSLAPGVTMRGTIVANNAAINMSSGDTLEGRALSTNGAVTLDGVLAYTPIGCGSPYLTGPNAPVQGATECYAIFSADGPVTNVGVTTVIGDIGSNNGTTTGFNPLFVTGIIHTVPDGSTALCATDLLNEYNYLNGLPYDIELLYPAQFGNNLVLTPHTYIMNGAVTFTDTLFLNAQGNPNAVFVIQINGAMATSTYSKVILINGTRSENVFWKVDGAVTINNNSIFCGTIVCNNGAMNINTSATMNGRVLTTNGALGVSAIGASMPPGCGGTSSPEIINEPTTQVVCIGNSATFAVSATGTNLTFQWRRGLINLVDGGNISGAGTAALTINPAGPADAGTDYNVIVSGLFTPPDTSDFVVLIVTTAPVIILQPLSQAACAGDSVSFSINITGTGVTYQWRKGTVNLINSGNITGATGSVLTINPVSVSDAAPDYNVIVTGACNPADTSSPAALTINNTAFITTEPVNQNACTGDSISFTVVASGVGLSYQWRRGVVNLINIGNISGVNTPTLTINPVTLGDAASNYNVIVSSGTCPTSDTSAMVSLTVNAAPVIIAGPFNQSTCAGDSVSFTVTATGTNLTYQWRKGLVNLVNTGNISGVTTAVLTINPVALADAASDYNVIVNSPCTPPDTSANASLTVNSAAVITTQPVSQVSCTGDSISFTVTATGTGITYQWRRGLVNLINTGNISGVNTATLTINPVGLTDAASDYNVIVSTISCPPADTSVLVSLTVNSAPLIVTGPFNQSTCTGDSISFTVIATGSGLTYQWRKGLVNLVNAGNISGVTTAVLTINPVALTDAAPDYNVIVTGVCSPADTSANAALTVNSAAVITTQPVSQAVCAGSAASFAVTATGTGLTYQWRRGVVILLNAGNVSGVTTPVLTINPAGITDVDNDYNVIVTGSSCTPPDTSAFVSLILNTAPVITSDPASMTVCENSSSGFIVNATGTGLTYQWRKGLVNLVNSGNISGVNTAILTFNPVTPADASTLYNVVVTGSCAPADSSANASLTVTAAPAANATSNSPVCTDSTIYLNTTAVSGGTYAWSGPNGFVSGLQNPEIPAAPVAAFGTYSLTVTASGCNSQESTVTVISDNCTDISIFIPQGFSPNGDGINDLFVISDIADYPGNTFTVFNRWGNKVFEAKPYQNNWDGQNKFGITMGNGQLPVGTYFYVLDLGNNTEPINGTIYLNR